MAKTTHIRGISNFRVTDVTYHRNGIAGRPFHSVRFSYEAEDFSPTKFMSNMLAIVPHGARLESGDTECFVIDMNNPTERWRGDNFIPLMVQALADHEKMSVAQFRKMMNER